jgi:hypothetical protein
VAEPVEHGGHDVVATEEQPVVLGPERQQPHVRAAAGHHGGIPAEGRSRRDQREEPFRPGQAPERVFAQLGEVPASRQVVADQGGDGLGHEDLAIAAQVPQAGGPVDRGAVVVIVPLVRLAGVHPHPHAERHARGPRLGVQRLACGHGRGHRCARPGEDRKGGVVVAAGLEQRPPGGRHRALDQRVVTLQRLGHRLGCPFPQLRGPFDIGQQERHHTRGHQLLAPFLGSWEGQRTVVGGHRPLRRPQLRPRFEAQLPQRGPDALVGAQRVGPPATSVEGDHEQHPAAFPQRLLGHQRFETGHPLPVAAEPQRRIGLLLLGAAVQLLEPRHLCPGRRPVGQLTQGPAPPQRQ